MGAVVGVCVLFFWMVFQAALLGHLFGWDTDYVGIKALGSLFFVLLIGVIVVIVGGILDAKGILPRNGDGNVDEFRIKWLIISYVGLLAVSVIACLVKAALDKQFAAVGFIGTISFIGGCTVVILVLWGIAFLVGNILSAEKIIPDSAVDGNINGYIFKRGGMAVVSILGILTIVRLIRTALPGGRNSGASGSGDKPPTRPIHRERKSCPTYKFWIGDSKEKAPRARYTDVSSARPIGQVRNRNGHLGCYAFGGHDFPQYWGVWIDRTTPDTTDAPSVIFKDGEIYSCQGRREALLATYGNGEIWRNNKLIGVYDGPDTGGAATAALLFDWVLW